MDYTVLFVEDEKKIRDIVADYFAFKECKLVLAKDGLSALERMETENFDLVLLDITMPKVDGFTVCKKIRQQQEVPIIFVTARTDEEDTLYGYEIGGDDYVTKPFSLSVLYAKAMALIKRSKGLVREEKLYGKDLWIDCKAQKVWVNEKEIALAPLEYKLLTYFMMHKGQVITREQLLNKIWGYDFEGTDRVIDNHIKKLRQALGASEKRIQTVSKAGYKWEAGEDEEKG